jgi:HAE1 family hydrophobic/amphiphilic exporter-1
MHKLAEICVRRPVFATVLVLVLTVFGVFGYLKLGVDWFPKVDIPVVLVTTVVPGTAPEEIETEVTDKIEEAVNTASGIDELRSVSTEGVSQVVIQFQLEKDVDVAAQEVRDRVNRILSELPQDIEQPIVEKMDPDAIPVIMLALSAPLPVKDISEYADKVLRRQVERVGGVGQVLLIGAQKRQINVELDPQLLRSYGLTVVDVARALGSQNVQMPGGNVKEGANEFTLRTLGRVLTVEELGQITVANRNGHVIRVSDVGRVVDGAEEAESIALLNDQPTILVQVSKQSGTNTVAVVEAVKERLAEIEETLPDQYKMQIVLDQSIFIEDSVDTVKEHLMLGATFAAIVVFFFLANLRTTVISALAIPISIISTFAVMQYLGFTLNMLTLLALTLSVGIVIDDAIVVLENIYRYIEEKKYAPKEAAVAATREIGLAVVAITLSLVAVFLPIAFMEGIVGRFMRSFGLTMAAAITISMLVSFTLTPMLASRWLRPVKEGENGHGATSKQRGFYRALEGGYLALLGFSLRHRWIVVLTCVALLALVPLEVKYAAKNFLPDDDRSEFQIDVRAPEGTSLEATAVILSRIARDVRALEGVEYTVMSVAGSQQRIANEGSVYVRLVDGPERTYSQFEMMDYIRKSLLPRYADQNLRMSVNESDAIDMGASNAAVQYVIGGPDMAKLEEYANYIADQVRKTPGAVDVDTNFITGKPQYGVVIDRAKAADLGVSVVDVAQTLRYLVAGDKVSDFNEKGEQYEVHVRGQAEYRNNIDALRLVTVPSTIHGVVPLGDVVRFEQGTGPAQINRLNRAREVTIMANMEPGASMQAILDRMDAAAAELNMGPDYKSTLAGESKEMQKAMRAFLMVFVMAFLFIYLVLAAQFESWLHPITILLSLPMTLPFALGSLFIFNQSINILTMLGIMVLFAVVKKNSILQIDHTNQLRAEGLPRYEAIMEANKDRLRPILMTTVAFVAGMIPLIVSTGPGSGTNRAISSIVIGGQTLSLLLTLLAVPVAYSLFDDVSQFVARLVHRGARVPLAERPAPADQQ